MFQRWVGVWEGRREGRRRDGVFGVCGCGCGFWSVVCGEEVMGVGIVLWMLRIRDRGGEEREMDMDMDIREGMEERGEK